MPRMRSAIYMGALTVPATASATVDVSGLLRDILPDQAFRIHALLITMQSSLEAGDITTLTLAKNITPSALYTLETWGVVHGIIGQWTQRKVAAAGVSEAVNLVVPLPEPLDFDKDDSINARLLGTNAAATDQTAYTTISIAYEVG